MSSGRSVSTVTYHHRRPAAVYGRRRRRAALGVLLAAVAGYAALPGHGTQLDARVGPAERPPSVLWPAQGQAALVIGGGRPAASPRQQPVPIASLAKVMTAYLTLERYPLESGSDGFTITVTPAQAATAAADESVVAVKPGEQLTERQLLEGLLVPSGNNVARMLASAVAGSESSFVVEMNAEARALGLADTTYTDPSGFDPGTVSTAADQLRIFRQAMRFTAFRQIVGLPSVTLPVAGTLRNFNPLIGDGYAGKTGSDSAAGGCLAFFTRVIANGRPTTAVGVVLGQGEGSDTAAILAAAGRAAEELTESAVSPSGMSHHTQEDS